MFELEAIAKANYAEKGSEKRVMPEASEAVDKKVREMVNGTVTEEALEELKKSIEQL